MKNKKIKKEKFDYRKLLASIIIIILLVLGLIILMGNGTTSSYAEKKYKTILVSPGETLWEIANTELTNNEYYSNSDIRHIVRELKELNNLTSSTLFPGYEITIPCL